MGRTKQAVQGIITSYLSYFVIIVVQIYLSPLILRKYGADALGAYAAILQLIGYLTLLDGALGISFNRYIAQAFGGPDRANELEKLLTAGVIIFSIVGLLNCVLSVTSAFFVQHIFTLSEPLAHDVKWALLLLGATSLLKGPLAIYPTFLNATQNMAFLNLVVTGSSVLRGALIVLAIYFGLGISGIVLGGVVAEILAALICYGYVRVKFRHSVFSLVNVGRSFFREILVFSKDSLIIQLTTKLRLQTDILLTGIMIGVSTASVYYSSITPPMMCFTLANLLMNSTLPGLNEIIGSGDREKIKEIYVRLYKIVLGLAFVVFFGIVFLNKYVVRYWVGDGQFIGWEINTLFAINIMLLVVGSYNGNFLISIGVVKKLARFGIYFSLIGFICTVLFVYFWGTWGLALSSFVVLIPGNLFNHYLITKELNTTLFFTRQA